MSAALRARRPVVALETSIVGQGLPRPRNLEAALGCEAAIREGGAVPATVALLDGRLRVGLGSGELEQIASASHKVSSRDLGPTLVQRSAGATTVAATMRIAAMAGIRFLATGGIGGVHRGAGESDDVSADLGALARYPVAVVCSGAKSILDLPRTLERLETLGVPVFGWRCEHFPAFWRRSSGLPVDWRFDDLPALAAAIRAHRALGTGTGIVVANPIPEAAEMGEAEHERALAGALEAVVARGIRGRAVTPALLAAVQQATGGKGIESNVALLIANARLAGELAAALAG